MKLVDIIIKNLKILFRSKGSAVIVTLGPLFFIALVSIAFNNSSNVDLNVGIVAPVENQLTIDFRESMKKDNYFLRDFETADECIQSIKEGLTHTCISLPDDFEVKNAKLNSIVFYVDNSRQNLVFQVIETVTKTIEGQERKISLNLTTNIIDVLFDTKSELELQVTDINELSRKIDDSQKKTISNTNELSEIDLKGDTGFSGSSINTQIVLLRDEVDNLDLKAEEIIDESRFFLSEVKGNTSFDTNDFKKDLDNLTDELNKTHSTTTERIDRLEGAITSAREALSSLESRLVSADVKRDNLVASLREVGSKMDEFKNNLESLSDRNENLITRINAVKITDAESISNPYETNIEPVVLENSKLSLLMPHLLSLLIMFLSILLCGTLLVLEKKSKAFFRNFTTPTNDFIHVFALFLTGLIVVIFQVAVVMAILYYFTSGLAINNFGIVLLTILLAITLFVLLGMCIGFIFNSQESITIASILIGSGMMLLSNLILPIESMSPALAKLSNHNPFVLTSKILTKSILFDLSIVRVGFLFLEIFIWIAVLALFLFLLYKSSKATYMKKEGIFVGIEEGAKKEYVELELIDGKKIMNLDQLAQALTKMKDEEFLRHCYNRDNDFSVWVREVLRERRLAKELVGKNKKQMIKIINEYLHEQRRRETKSKKYRKDTFEETRK